MYFFSPERSARLFLLNGLSFLRFDDNDIIRFIGSLGRTYKSVEQVEQGLENLACPGSRPRPLKILRFLLLWWMTAVLTAAVSAAFYSI